MDQISVFIYGTLLPGQSNHHVVSPYLKASSREGWIEARLVDCGDYPAAVRDDIASMRNSIIRGQWIVVDREGLAAMDILEAFSGIEESNDYERAWLCDSKDAAAAGWAYVWGVAHGYPAIEQDYWPDYYASKQKEAE
ncbi:gamma-glutamylcyclotransferase family protein [Paenibacillus sinopodophylli]|uniref:gamma-glutamylcyclotransferase family protein n=1 Tax=Paenibacillus sinopodophylli TaxID=1837342 RepID=UPI00110CFF58|nr:gamma-glutamylcyclotransferase family protein [Paenibacillus sinopodophylli]